MTTLYLALFQLAASLLARKVQQDTLDAAAYQKLKDDTEAGWQKIQQAHVELQTSKDKANAAP